MGFRRAIARRRFSTLVRMSAPKPRTHLLSEDDLFCIHHHGAPADIRHELIQLHESGRVIFTMRGIQFYRHAVEQHGVPVQLAAIQTEADVLRMHVDLGAAAFSRLVSQLDQDWLASDDSRRQTQAIIKGALDAIAHAANRLREAAVPG